MQRIGPVSVGWRGQNRRIFKDLHGGPESGEKFLLLRKTAFPAQFAVEVIFKMVDGAAGIFDFPIFPEISDFPD